MTNGTRTTLPLPSLCPPQLCAEKPGLDFSAEMGRSQRASLSPSSLDWFCGGRFRCGLPLRCGNGLVVRA